jgi:hypothetical protein
MWGYCHIITGFKFSVFQIIRSNGARQEPGLNRCVCDTIFTDSQILKSWTNQWHKFTHYRRKRFRLMHVQNRPPRPTDQVFLTLIPHSRHMWTTPLRISKIGRKASGERLSTRATQFFNPPVCSQEGRDGRGVKNSHTVLVRNVRQETIWEA